MKASQPLAKKEDLTYATALQVNMLCQVIQSKIMKNPFRCRPRLTHAEGVRVGHAGSDLHFAVGALGARLTGLGAPQLLGKSSRTAHFAQRVPSRAALAHGALAAGALRTGGAHAVRVEEEETVLAFALRVLGGRASGQRRDAGRTLGAGRALAEALGRGEGAWRREHKVEEVPAGWNVSLSSRLLARSLSENLSTADGDQDSRSSV